MQDLRSHYTTQKPPLTRSRIPPDTTPLPYGAVVPTVRAYKVYHRHDREQKPTYVTRSGKLHVRVSTIVEYWHSVGIPGDYVTSFAKDKRTLTTQDCLSAFQKLLAVCRDSQGDEGHLACFEKPRDYQMGTSMATLVNTQSNHAILEACHTRNYMIYICREKPGHSWANLLYAQPSDVYTIAKCTINLKVCESL